MACGTRLLWLCALQPWQEREPGGRDSASRDKLRMPNARWLDDRLDEADIENPWHGLKPQRRRDREWPLATLRLVALIAVRDGIGFQGLSTSWSDEAFLLWEYYKRPRDAFTLNIVSVFKLAEPIPVMSRIASRGRPARVEFSRGAISTYDIHCKKVMTQLSK